MLSKLTTNPLQNLPENSYGKLEELRKTLAVMRLRKQWKPAAGYQQEHLQTKTTADHTKSNHV